MLMAIGGFVAAGTYKNMSVMGLGVCGGLVLTLIWVLCADSLSPSIKHYKASGTEFTKFCGHVSLALLPLCVSIPLSSCFFHNYDVGSSGYEKIWIIDEDVNVEGRDLFAVPFFQRIRSISSGQTVDMFVVATTKDNVQIKGYLRAELRLVSDESTILRAVKTLMYPDAEIKGELEAILQRNFRKAIAQHDLTDLQNYLVLEWKTGKDISDQSLNAAGLEWAGTLAVTNLHVHFGKG